MMHVDVVFYIVLCRVISPKNSTNLGQILNDWTPYIEGESINK